MVVLGSWLFVSHQTGSRLRCIVPCRNRSTTTIFDNRSLAERKKSNTNRIGTKVSRAKTTTRHLNINVCFARTGVKTNSSRKRSHCLELAFLPLVLVNINDHHCKINENNWNINENHCKINENHCKNQWKPLKSQWIPLQKQWTQFMKSQWAPLKSQWTPLQNQWTSLDESINKNHWKINENARSFAEFYATALYRETLFLVDANLGIWSICASTKGSFLIQIGCTAATHWSQLAPRIGSRISCWPPGWARPRPGVNARPGERLRWVEPTCKVQKWGGLRSQWSKMIKFVKNRIFIFKHSRVIPWKSSGFNKSPKPFRQLFCLIQIFSPASRFLARRRFLGNCIHIAQNSWFLESRPRAFFFCSKT